MTSSTTNLTNRKGLAKPSSTEQVFSISDFPTPSGGLITLDPLVAYQINGPVDVSPNKIAGNIANSIFGVDPINDVLISNTTGDFISGVDDTVTITTLTISCPNANAFNFKNTAGNEKTAIFSTISVVVVAASLGIFENMRRVGFFTGGVVVPIASGVTFTGSLNGEFVSSFFADEGLIGSGVRYDFGSAVFDGITIENSAHVSTASSVFVEGVTANGNLAGGGIARVVHNPIIGTAPSFVGVAPGDSQWFFLDNKGIADSIPQGDMQASVYDPTTVAGDAFSMGNMIETGTAKVFTNTERTKLGSLTGGRYLGVFADLSALQTAHPTGVHGDTATVTSPNGNMFYWNTGTVAWEDSGTGYVGNMLTAVYDPTAVGADAFSMDNMVEGAATKIFTSTERTKLAGIEAGAEVNDVDSVAGKTGVVTLDTDDVSEAANLYYTEVRVDANTNVSANTAHRGSTANPHSVTKTQVGLGNADNTSDLDKPISTATQTALDDKLATVSTDATLTGDGTSGDPMGVATVATIDLGTFDANDAIFPSSNPAAASSRNGHPIIVFDDTTAESILLSSLIPENYGAGDISIDIDWIAETATTGGVTWGVEFERNAPGGTDIDSDSFAAQQTGTSTTNATSGIITRTTITLTQAEADAIAASDAYRMRIQRVVGDGGDDMVGDAQIVRFSGRG